MSFEDIVLEIDNKYMNDYETLEENINFLSDVETIYRKEILRRKSLLLFQGNCLDINTFDKEFIDLTVTSPPYNVGIGYNSNDDELNYEQYLDFSEKWITNCYQWSKTQARMLMNIPLDKNKGGQRAVGADLTKIAQKVGWKYHSTIVWNEGNISRRTAWGSWLSASAPYVIAPVELIVVLYKDSWKKTNGTKSNTINREEFMEWTNGVWTFNGESKKRIGHPAPFPRELPRRAIKLFSYERDIIFDPFCGSGTTLIEAELNNRIGIGLEIDESYCELAKNRIQKELGSLDLVTNNKFIETSEAKLEDILSQKTIMDSNIKDIYQEICKNASIEPDILDLIDLKELIESQLKNFIENKLNLLKQ